MSVFKSNARIVVATVVAHTRRRFLIPLFVAIFVCFAAHRVGYPMLSRRKGSLTMLANFSVSAWEGLGICFFSPIETRRDGCAGGAIQTSSHKMKSEVGVISDFDGISI